MTTSNKAQKAVLHERLSRHVKALEADREAANTAEAIRGYVKTIERAQRKTKSKAQWHELMRQRIRVVAKLMELDSRL